MAFTAIVSVFHRFVDVTVYMGQRYAFGFAQYPRRCFGK